MSHLNDKMLPVFLGNGAGFYPQAGNTSAYFLNDGHLYLIDCGETVFCELLNRGVLEDVKSVTAVISHLHSDHCGSLSNLIIYCRYTLNVPFYLCVPEDKEYTEQLTTLLRLMGSTDHLYTLVKENELPCFGPYQKLHYLRTEHVSCLLCHSFVLDAPEGSLFYSADTCEIAPLQEFIASHEKIIGVCFDVTDADFPGNVHVCLTEAAAAIPSELKDRTFFMHLNSQACAEKCHSMGFQTV